MKIKNMSCISVYVECNAKRYLLSPQGELELPCAAQLSLKLSHTYKSTAPSPEKLFRSELTEDLITALTAGMTPAPFQLVMDSEYILSTTAEEEVICIKRERTRPTPDCSYDRLILENAKTIHQKLYRVPEETGFIRRYAQAVSKTIKIIFGICLGVLLALSFGFTCLALLGSGKILISFLIGIGIFFGLGFLPAIGLLIGYLINRYRIKDFSNTFRSDVIEKHFNNAAVKKDPSYSVD